MKSIFKILAFAMLGAGVLNSCAGDAPENPEPRRKVAATISVVLPQTGTIGGDGDYHCIFPPSLLTRIFGQEIQDKIKNSATFFRVALFFAALF